MKELLTTSEVAAILRVHVQTVYRLADEGVIPGIRIGRSWRFRKKEILDLISNKRRRQSRLGRSLGELDL